MTDEPNSPPADPSSEPMPGAPVPDPAPAEAPAAPAVAAGAPPAKPPDPPLHSPRERARRLYVTLAAGTLEEAANAVGLNPTTLRGVAAREGWTEERRAYAAEERKRVYADSAENEAKAQGTARRLAWKATARALELVVDRLEGGGKPPTAFEAEAIARTALALSGVGDLMADEAAEKLRALPLRSVYDRLRDVLKGYGADVPADLEEAVSAAARAEGNGSTEALPRVPPGAVPPATTPNGHAGPPAGGAGGDPRPPPTNGKAPPQ